MTVMTHEILLCNHPECPYKDCSYNQCNLSVDDLDSDVEYIDFSCFKYLDE